MKFIFPQNYNLKSKFLGFIDYSTLIINLIWIFLIFNFVSLFVSSLSIKLSIVIIFCLPLVLFSTLSINNENTLNVIVYLIKYIVKPKIYIFYK